ncbi:hypothetical protein PPERSA_03442 [Pseudocohnilembus persalinus]|uniref:Schlafen AlbA-2 domain-containing protein n=1 Tax=Pseudocohnilembus persalinus TaxID=266149 RepID=A0A0V0QBP9_PSEPJ|nr:hypothetical protein PPERSA_03442 [Pseudocohnilembus persalinus]|eukprot:KRW99641.1 hypothetical protein PPERSA_03442 [Pseudocohnilembus persalinus]
MLNSKGGTILIGVNDDCQVVGLNLTTKQQDNYKLFIHNQVLYNQKVGILEPTIEDKIQMSFIPVQTQNQIWIKQTWIYKLHISPDQTEKVYTLQNNEKSNNFNCFQRLDGQNRKLNLQNFKELMYSKSKQFNLKKFEKIHECKTIPDEEGRKRCSEKVINQQNQDTQKSKSNSPKKKKKTNDQLKRKNKEILAKPVEDLPILRNYKPIQKVDIQENTQQQVKIFKNLNELKIRFIIVLTWSV